MTLELSTSIRIDLGTSIGVIYDFSLLIFFSTSLPIFSNLRHHYRRHAPSSPFSPILFFPFFLFFIYLPFLFIILFYFCFPKTHQPSLSLVDHRSVAVGEPLLAGDPFLGQSSSVSHCRLMTSSPFLFIIIIIIIITFTICFLYFFI